MDLPFHSSTNTADLKLHASRHKIIYFGTIKRIVYASLLIGCKNKALPNLLQQELDHKICTENMQRNDRSNSSSTAFILVLKEEIY